MTVPEDWNVPSAIRVRLGEKAGKQRAMFADGHLLIILHKVPRPNVLEREGAYFWRDPSGRWLATVPGDGIAALRQFVESYDAAVDKLEEQFHHARQTSEHFPILQHIVRVSRASRHVYEALQKAREAVKDSRDLIDLRDRASEIDRASDLLHTDVKNALDYAIARENEAQTRASNELSRMGHRLNTLAAWFLPLTALASVFGMNYASGFDRESPGVFWTVLIVGVATGFALRTWLPAGLGSESKSLNNGGRISRSQDHQSAK